MSILNRRCYIHIVRTRAARNHSHQNLYRIFLLLLLRFLCCCCRCCCCCNGCSCPCCCVAVGIVVLHIQTRVQCLQRYYYSSCGLDRLNMFTSKFMQGSISPVEISQDGRCFAACCWCFRVRNLPLKNVKTNCQVLCTIK